MRPGWYQDPSGRFPLRWHDGIQWTPQVMDGWQQPAVDPLPAMMDTPPGAATTTAPPPVPPPLVSPLSGHPPAPAPVPGAPVSNAALSNVPPSSIHLNCAKTA